MNNEKVLSNSELLNITGGSKFLKISDIDDSVMISDIVICKYGVYYHIPPMTKMYGVKPIEILKKY